MDKINMKNATASDSDDDCILVEKCPAHITIVDDNDDSDSDDDSDDMDSTADVSKSIYHSLHEPFSPHIASTPCAKSSTKLINIAGINSNPISTYNQYPPSYANVVSHKQNSMNRNPIQGGAPFFVDVAGKSYLGNVSYNTVAPLLEKTQTNDDDVIILDNTTINDKKATLKESGKIESSSEEEEEEDMKDDSDEGDSDDVDDSVVFVSETNTNDFIPINGVADVSSSRVAEIPKASVAQKRANLYSELFTRTEKKQLEAYNTNTYNPHAGEVFTSKKRMVIIDGSNVAFKHSLDKIFSVHGLKIAIEYFEKMGHEVKAVIPQFRMNNYKSSDPPEMEKLHRSGKIVQTPCKNLPGLTSSSYDDRFILQLASELDAVVVSNDNYRDLLHENPAFKKIIETRVVGYTWCNDIFILPKDPYGRWGPALDMILNRS